MREFHFVDFAAHFQKGFRNHIVSVTEVPALIKAFDRYGCYATYFLYSYEILSYMSAQEATKTIAGYEGKVWAPFLPIDIDHPELSSSLQAARLLRAIFFEHWQIDPKALHIYFSGLKGFHLMLDTRLFGNVLPAKGLPLIFDSMRRHLAQGLPEHLRATLDLTIGDRVRLLRLPNTIHEKSKLNKIILSHDEISQLSVDEIRTRARTIQPLELTDETGFISRTEIHENHHAAELYQGIRRQLRHFRRQPFDYRFRRPVDLARIAFPCAGAQRIWESHVETGYRNNCAIRLCSELRLLGLSEEEASQKLTEWNEKNRIELSPAELKSIVRSAYQRRFPYRYSCRDQVLRRFCPLANYESCRQYVLKDTQPRRGAKQS